MIFGLTIAETRCDNVNITEKFRLLFLIFTLLSAAICHVHATTILDSPHLTDKEKNYLFSVKELLQEENVTAAWRGRFDRLKVPPTLRQFNQTLLEAIDFQLQAPQSIKKNAEIDQHYRKAYKELKAASLDSDAVKELHNVLYEHGGEDVCIGGPCW